MAGILPINVLGEIVSAGTLLAFVTVCIGVMVLRVTKPDLPRPFRLPSPFLIGSGGVLFCGAMLVSLFWTGGTLSRIVIWTLIGTAIYFLYGYRHSVLRNGGNARASAAAPADSPAR